MLKDYATTDKILFDHLNNSPRAKNATYIPPSTQNDVIGSDLILSGIVSEVKAACFFFVLADEVSCRNVEYMPICLRFIDKECDIQKEFVGFMKLRTKGKSS